MIYGSRVGKGVGTIYTGRLCGRAGMGNCADKPVTIYLRV